MRIRNGQKIGRVAAGTREIADLTTVVEIECEFWIFFQTAVKPRRKVVPIFNSCDAGKVRRCGAGRCGAVGLDDVADDGAADAVPPNSQKAINMQHTR
jgi:hypothetical protein